MKRVSVILFPCSSVRLKAIMRISILRLLLGVMMFVISPLPAIAEVNLDLLVAAPSRWTTMSLSLTRMASQRRRLPFGVHFNTSATGGGRVGYWFDRLPWYGVGVDVFYFAPNVDTQTVPATVTIPGIGSGSVPASVANTSIGVIGVGFDVLGFGCRFTSEAYPKGQLRPFHGWTRTVPNPHNAVHYQSIRATRIRRWASRLAPGSPFR